MLLQRLELWRSFGSMSYLSLWLWMGGEQQYGRRLSGG